MGNDSSRCTNGSILGSLFFLIYINDLTNNLKNNVKLFADDTYLFSEICDPLKTAYVLNHDLRTLHYPKHPDLYFHNLVVEKVKNQKHLGLKLDKRLNFKEHLIDEFANVSKGIEMLKKLSNYPPCHSLVTLYKTFIRPHLDSADIIYGKPNNMNICNKFPI